MSNRAMWPGFTVEVESIWPSSSGFSLVYKKLKGLEIEISSVWFFLKQQLLLLFKKKKKKKVYIASNCLKPLNLFLHSTELEGWLGNTILGMKRIKVKTCFELKKSKRFFLSSRMFQPFQNYFASFGYRNVSFWSKAIIPFLINLPSSSNP